MNKADSSRALLILALICTAYRLIPFHRMTPSIMSAGNKYLFHSRSH